VSFSCELVGLVDPGLRGDERWSWSPSHKVFRVELVGGIEYLLALPQDEASLAAVDQPWHERAEPRVAVFRDEAAGKSLTEGAAVLNATEALRELRATLQRVELPFRIGGSRWKRAASCEFW